MTRWSSRRAALIAALVALALISISLPAAAAPPGWGDPVRIRTSATGVQDLRVGVDARGRVSIVAHDGIGLFSLRQRASGWSFVRLVKDPLILTQIAGVFDRAGHAWVVYARDCDGADCTDAGLYLLTTRYGGPNSGWTATPRRLVAGPMRDPAFQVGGDGRMHLAYTDKKGRLHYATAMRAAGPWTDVKVWGDDQGYLPSLVLDADGRANLVAMRFPATLPGVFGVGWAREVGRPAEPAFRTRMVPATGEFDETPFLALDPTSRDVRVIWRHDPYCGVAPCPPEPTRGTWTRRWMGGMWATAVQLSGAAPAGIRYTPGGRAKILTHRPSVVAQTSTGWSTAVLLAKPIESGDNVVAIGFALTVTGKARVVYADAMPDPRDGTGIYVVRER